jgi:starch-binding outer membrane protein SusE/F
MKSVTNKFLILFAFIAAIASSCKKDETQVVAGNGTAGTLSASATSIVLDKTKVDASDTSISFTITKADFGYNAAVSTVLQIDSMGDNWKTPQTIIVANNATRKTLSTSEFNSALLKLNLPPGKQSQVQVRAMHSISSRLPSIYSNVLTLTVTPFSLVTYVYVPGAYQGWNPGAADSLASATGNGIYSGVINFTGSDLNFKITTARNWNNAYGAGATAGTVSTSGGNLLAPATGGLLLTLNTNNNTLTMEPQWSIIGDATPGGWGSDTNMFLDKTTNTWNITTTLKSDGGQAFKFRFKNDWAVNLGGSGGTLTAGGANITVPKTATAGDTYKITLNPTANTYTLIKQ